MSSHHFVREQQEPALLILALDEFTYATLGELLEWVPTIICNEASWEKLLSWGVKVDVLLCTRDFANREQVELHAPLQILLMEEDKEKELCEAIRYLKESGQRGVNVIGLPHRHLLGLQETFSGMEPVIWDGALRYVFVKSGYYRKWWPGGNLQLHAPEGSFIEKSHNNDAHIIPITYATFVELEEGFTTFTSNTPFWVGEFVPYPRG